MTRSSMGAAFPTPEQELLLQAALLGGSAALDAWKQWKSQVDFESLDAGSQQLLPQLYVNLHDQVVDEPLMGRLTGFYRLTWYKNQALFHEIEATFRVFQDAGIHTLLLKGAALSLLYYHDYGLCPMNDFDVAVAEQDIPLAISLLHKLGWRHKGHKTGASLEHLLTAFHSVGYFNNHSEFNLHSRIGFAFWQYDLPNVWKDATPAALNGIDTLVMHPADLLIHVCVHGIAWNPIPPLRWIADAMVLLRAEPNMDWARVIASAQEAHLAYHLYAALNYLRNLLDADIPASVLHELESASLSQTERFRMRIALNPSDFPARVLLHYDGYNRVRRRQNAPPSVNGFLRYLQQIWEVDHVWQTPLQGAKHIRRFLLSTFI